MSEPEQDYRVTWIINELATTPHGAALAALEDQRRPDTEATVFICQPRADDGSLIGTAVEVDLGVVVSPLTERAPEVLDLLGRLGPRPWGLSQLETLGRWYAANGIAIRNQATRLESACTDRRGEVLRVSDVVDVLSPLAPEVEHARSGFVTTLIPGEPGDIPLVEVTDMAGHKVVVNAVNVQIATSSGPKR